MLRSAELIPRSDYQVSVFNTHLLPADHGLVASDIDFRDLRCGGGEEGNGGVVDFYSGAFRLRGCQQQDAGATGTREIHGNAGAIREGH